MDRWPLTWTQSTRNSTQFQRNPIMTPACPIGDPGLITRRSQVQILPPQLRSAEALPTLTAVGLRCFDPRFQDSRAGASYSPGIPICLRRR